MNAGVNTDIALVVLWLKLEFELIWEPIILKLRDVTIWLIKTDLNQNFIFFYRLIVLFSPFVIKSALHWELTAVFFWNYSGLFELDAPNVVENWESGEPRFAVWDSGTFPLNFFRAIATICLIYSLFGLVEIVFTVKLNVTVVFIDIDPDQAYWRRRQIRDFIKEFKVIVALWVTKWLLEAAVSLHYDLPFDSVDNLICHVVCRVYNA